jgi:hypothetical protein
MLAHQAMCHEVHMDTLSSIIWICPAEFRLAAPRNLANDL